MILRFSLLKWLVMVGVACCLLVAEASSAEKWQLKSLSLRARVSGENTIGKEQPEEFEEYDIAANFAMPWQGSDRSGWRWGSRLMTSVGVIRGAGETAFVGSLIPEITFGSTDGRFVLDMGAGGALLSRYCFGDQDYGGPFQFALTVGASIPLYRNLGIGYRFLHYSDAGLHGEYSTGADFHMIEIIYRF